MQQQAPPPPPAAAQPAPQPTQAPPPAAPAPAAVSFGSCAEARAAGAAPLYQGQPGYSSKLDRDHDGVACE
ncbi:excalibur calcium-binding domain-containing protein [Frankia sp. Mgl5]|nr:excalibur calcium-binding domain-containing protein [Frankia sp. Mgl5]